MSKTKMGFSTGKGFLTAVDKATEAEYAEKTSFTNEAWQSFNGSLEDFELDNLAFYWLNISIQDENNNYHRLQTLLYTEVALFGVTKVGDMHVASWKYTRYGAEWEFELMTKYIDSVNKTFLSLTARKNGGDNYAVSQAMIMYRRIR